ncbi:hypothetical protein Y032_0080g1361 [Ancylostoma ceylanicum]|uniref:Uncharacterized protein n=1 Tax=Ancylostoma ceylanicum TaxID=53326 RepID=A0A016TSM6_9BILA|nr:hypothetical protein Y032_0080g1361 [Ancylostoma ceylanicum]
MSKTLKNTGSASCTRGFIPQWKLIEGTAWFSNTEILVLSVIAAAEKFIWINNLDFSPLPPCLRRTVVTVISCPIDYGLFQDAFWKKNDSACSCNLERGTASVVRWLSGERIRPPRRWSRV